MLYPLKLTNNQIDFIKNHFKEQIEALNLFYPIIQDAVQNGLPRDSIVFGGGTALAIYKKRH